MKYSIYSVLNRNTREWSLPMCIISQSQAMRIFYLQIQSSELMQKFPDDYELYEIGSFESDLDFSDGDFVSPFSDLSSVVSEDYFVASVRDCLKWYDSQNAERSDI